MGEDKKYNFTIEEMDFKLNEESIEASPEGTDELEKIMKPVQSGEMSFKVKLSKKSAIKLEWLIAKDSLKLGFRCLLNAIIVFLFWKKGSDD